MTLSRLAAGQARSQTTHGYVLKTLRDAILDGTLPAGARLIQAELAAQLDVSITPVREALRDLAGEGIVELDPHRGSWVRRLDLDEVREIYELRITLEPIMVRRMVTSMSEEALTSAERLQHRMAKIKGIATWSELNRQFHALFVENEKSSRLGMILSGLRDSAAPYVSMSLRAGAARRAESDAEHAQLLEYYRARDHEGAVRLTVQHLNSTLATIEQAHDDGLL
ncbi:GntR family transcriptional regulator [Streptomyces aurantiacus]|uniref:GntR family transcriptional regulator n=1 Tax=Streptomyces aurantiacus TaxID=47760 RepID=UPI0027D884BC|nr:GntR family transcriptional regulator [Streptomyces aurantiacus]